MPHLGNVFLKVCYSPWVEPAEALACSCLPISTLCTLPPSSWVWSLLALPEPWVTSPTPPQVRLPCTSLLSAAVNTTWSSSWPREPTSMLRPGDASSSLRTRGATSTLVRRPAGGCVHNPGSIHSPDFSPDTQGPDGALYIGHVLVWVIEVLPLGSRVSPHYPEPQLSHVYSGNHDRMSAPCTFSCAFFSPVYAGISGQIVGPTLHHSHAPMKDRTNERF